MNHGTDAQARPKPNLKFLKKQFGSEEPVTYKITNNLPGPLTSGLSEERLLFTVSGAGLFI